MEWLALKNLLQIIVGLGVLKVWLVRGRWSTPIVAGLRKHSKIGDPLMKSLPPR